MSSLFRWLWSIALVSTVMVGAGANLAAFEDSPFEGPLPFPLIAPIDTIHAIAIYACGETASTYLLPDWWADVWDSTLQNSLPRYYKDISFGKHGLFAEPKGRPGDSLCIVSSYAFDDCYDTAFARDIIVRADSFIDFGLYDNDGPDTIPNSGDDDGMVDELFLMVVNEDTFCGKQFLGLSHITNDTCYSDSCEKWGGKIKIWRGTSQCVPERSIAMVVVAHEYGHHLGLPEYWCWGGSHMPELPTGSGLGSFGVMGRVNGFEGRTSPYNPFFRSQHHTAIEPVPLNWLTTTLVNESSYNQPIEDITSGEVFELGQEFVFDPSNPKLGDQRFLVSCYLKTSFWEERWPEA